MSQENVESIRRAFEAFNRGDLDAAFEIADPDVVLRPPEPWRTVEGGAALGRDAVYRFFAEYRDAFGPDAAIEEQFDAGDRVVTRYRNEARGDHSGLEGELRFTMVHTFREGRVVMLEVFTDHADALRAAGLAESTMSQENVEIVRRSLDEWRDHADAWALVDRFWDPDADYYPVRKFPEARPCHGRDEIAQFQADYLSAWDRYEAVINDLIPVGDDRVLAHTTVRAEGRESGLHLDGDLYHCHWLRHQRILRVEDHLTLTGALRALGLSGDSLEAAGLRE